MLMKLSKTLLSAVVVLALVGSVMGVKAARGKTAEEPAAALLAVPRAKGNAAAALRVIEFIDYQCPSCAKASFFLHELVKRHPQEIYLEVKYFPLRGHAHSMTAAKLVECSRRQGKFWEAHTAVFESQPAWRDLDDARPILTQVLQAAGVDLAAADRCQSDPKTEKTVTDDREAALKLGLKSTPTFFINGEMFVGFMAMSDRLKQSFPDAASIVLPADNAGPPPIPRGYGYDEPPPDPRSSVVYANKEN